VCWKFTKSARGVLFYIYMPSLLAVILAIYFWMMSMHGFYLLCMMGIFAYFVVLFTLNIREKNEYLLRHTSLVFTALLTFYMTTNLVVWRGPESLYYASLMITIILATTIPLQLYTIIKKHSNKT